MRRLTTLAIPLVLTIALAACSDDGNKVTTGGNDGDTTTTAPTNPDSPDTTVAPQPIGTATITVLQGGGFVPVEVSFANQPTVAIYADGTVLQPGAVAAIYPGPALAPLQRSLLPDGAVDDLVQAIRDANVLGAEFGQPNVADAPGTTVSLTVDGKTEQASAYALGFDDDPQLTEDQRSRRAALSALVEQLTNPEGATPAGTYQPTALAVLARPVDPAAGDPEVQPNELDWPLADLATHDTETYGGACFGVTGADTDKVLPLLDDATAITKWNSGGKQWNLVFKAMLPGATPCAPNS
jgi:hypothetical protein